MIIIKLGGSVITDKSSYHTFKKEQVRRLCLEIKKSGQDVIVVHGAGSFGHIIADKYDINGGYKNEEQIEAVAKICSDMRELNQMVVKELNDAGIPSVSVPPGSCFHTENRKLVIDNEFVLRSMLDKGIMPVAFGDVVQDTKLGFAILSGDQIIERFADMFEAEKVIFVSDIDGLYDSDPKTNKKAKLFKKVNMKTLNSIDTDTSISDVTGGVRNKMETMLRISSGRRECFLVNGTVDGRLKSLLEGNDVICTRTG